MSERVARSPTGEAKEAAQSDRRTVTELMETGERMAGRGSKSRILTRSRVLVTWRVPAAMPSTVASGETMGALHNMSGTVGALDNMPATEAVGEDPESVDDAGAVMLLRNMSVRCIFVHRASVSTILHIGRLWMSDARRVPKVLTSARGYVTSTSS